MRSVVCSRSLVSSLTLLPLAQFRSDALPLKSLPELSLKIKRRAKAAVEAELAKALEKLEIEESTTDELKKCQLQIKRSMQKAMAGAR